MQLPAFCKRQFPSLIFTGHIYSNYLTIHANWTIPYCLSTVSSVEFLFKLASSKVNVLANVYVNERPNSCKQVYRISFFHMLDGCDWILINYSIICLLNVRHHARTVWFDQYSCFSWGYFMKCFWSNEVSVPNGSKHPCQYLKYM